MAAIKICHRGRINDRLYDRTRLLPGQRVVDLSGILIVEVVAARHGAYRAAYGIGNHDSAPVLTPVAAPTRLAHLRAQGLLCRVLQLWVKGGVDIETALEKRIGAEFRLQLRLHEIGKNGDSAGER